MTTPPHLRVSDAEREAVIDHLRRHTADGRLSLDEFEARTDEVVAARTGAELKAALRELPALPVTMAHPTRPRPSFLSSPVGRYLLVAAAIIGVASLAAGHLVLWPMFIFCFFWFKRGGHHHHRHREHRARSHRRDDEVTYA